MELSLSNLLSEFQEALKQEIDYIKKHGGGKTFTATNGKLLHRAGPHSIYLFDISIFLPSIEDAEVTVAIEKEVAKGTITRLSGFEIELSLDKYFGDIIPQATVSSEPWKLLETLSQRLGEVKDGSLSVNRDFAHLLFYPPPKTPQAVTLPSLSPLPKGDTPITPIEDQLNVLEACLGLDISFVWGPPGTGKTTTLAWLTEALLKQDKSVLIVSHGNVPVDRAILGIAELFDSDHADRESKILLDEGKILRFPKLSGSPEQRSNLADKVEIEQISQRLTATLKEEALEWRKKAFNERLRERYCTLYLTKHQELEANNQNVHRIVETIGSKEKDFRAVFVDISDLEVRLARIESTLEEAISAGKIKRFFKGLDPVVLAQRKAETKAALTVKVRGKESLGIEIQRLKNKKQEVEGEILKLKATLENQPQSFVHICINSNCNTHLDSPIRPRLSSFQCPDCGSDYIFDGSSLPLPSDISGLNKVKSTAVSKAEEFEKIQTGIEKKIQEIQATILNEARVIATTLTKAYLAKEIFGRRFDAVILDEASMAPMPAVFFASCLAKEKIIIIGDFCQLAPICLSEKESYDPEETKAQKWMGRDIFEQVGIVDKGGKRNEGYARLAALKTQFRMVSPISRLANELVYGNILKDASHLCIDRGNAQRRITLYDTSEWNPYCSREEGGHSKSHFNIRHALLCLSIARQKYRDSRGIVILTPYRAQAKLIKALVDEDDCLKGRVKVSNVHRFQGEESNTVIFDLVDSHPLYSPGILFKENRGKRMVNVAMTRAQQELILIGNSSFLSKLPVDTLICQILNHVRREGFNIVYLHDEIDKTFGDDFRKVEDLLHPFFPKTPPERIGVYTQANFYPQFRQDIQEALSSVIICSPFLTLERAGDFVDMFRFLVSQQKEVVIVTKPPRAQGSFLSDEIQSVIQSLRAIGVKIIERPKVHEKIAIIDGTIVWDGSLNILSHTKRTTESMIRFRDSNLAVELARLHELSNLVEEEEKRKRRVHMKAELEKINSRKCRDCEKSTKVLYYKGNFHYVCDSRDKHRWQNVPCSDLERATRDEDKICPECGQPVRCRTIQKGNTLIGCTAYPACKFILKY